MGELRDLDAYRKRLEQDRDPSANRSAAAARIQARKALSALEGIRGGIQNEAESLSKYFRSKSIPRPDDFDLRMARASYAIYLLDTLEDVLHVADKRDDASMLCSFLSASNAVGRLLDKDYFSKSAVQILAGYQRFEQDLRACASRCGIETLVPEAGAETTKMKFAQMIDEINFSF